MSDEQFQTLLLKLDALTGALGGIEDAIRATGSRVPPPPSSRPSSGKLKVGK